MKKQFLSLLLLCSAAASTFSMSGMDYVQKITGFLSAQFFRFLNPERPASLERLNSKLFIQIHENASTKDIAITIASGANINAVDAMGWTPLLYAALKKQVELVKFLLDNGASATFCDNGGMTPLNIVCKDFNFNNDNFKIAELLLKYGAAETLNIKGGCFQPLTPLQSNGNIALQKLLLRWGAQPFDNSTKALKAQLEQELLEQKEKDLKSNAYYKKLMQKLDPYIGVPDLANIVAEYAYPCSLEDTILINQNTAKMHADRRKEGTQSNSVSLSSNQSQNGTQMVVRDNITRNPLDEEKRDDYGNVVAPASQSTSSAPMLIEHHANMPQPPQFVRDHYEQHEPDNAAYRTWLQAQESAEPAQQGSVEDLD